MRRWALAGLAIVFAARLDAQTFKLCSQNTLHLGYSSSDQVKIDALKRFFTTCDVTLLQEVMRRALDPPPLPAPPPNPPVPPLPNGALRAVTPDPGTGFTWNVPFSDILGKTSYKESYSFIVKNTFTIYRNNTFQIYFPTTPGLANKFARPPAAILLQTGNAGNDNWIWLVDYHAIFGKKQSDREAEVRAMAEYAAELKAKDIDTKTYSKIIIGGDWNLDADNGAYAPLKTGFTIGPNEKSSLTTTGEPSEKYDHFAWSNVANLTVSGARVVPMTAQEMKDWRRLVSDHMGIECTVTNTVVP